MKKLLVNALLVTSISSTLLAGNYSNESEVLSSMGGVSTGTNSTNFSVVGETFVSMSGAKSGFLLKGESTYVTSSSGVAIDLDYTTNGYDQDTVTHTDIETSEVVSTNTEKWIAVVAQNVENLDTYQVEVSFDASRLALIATAEDNSFGGLHNLLKKNGGTTIGFQAVETGAGIINISNALVGTDEAIAPEGTGLIALLKFKALDADTNNTINLQNVHFVNSSGSNALITNHINATFNPETINQAPVVNAGVDQTIIEGESASLQCVANDVDGSVTSTEWLKDGVLVSSQDRYTTPSTLAVGSYVYSCKATDDDGATNSDALTLTVEAPNQAPVVNAGADQTIIEGESASLQCVANDVDGSVTSTEWLKDGVLVSSQDRYTTPSTLAVGSYVYSCKATDDDGATGADSVVVTVSAAPTYPDLIVQSPSVNDTTLTEGQSFTASAIVKNQGAGSSASTTLRYYISTNSIISTSDTQLGTDAVSVLSSNGTSSENETVSTSLTSGSYWVGACVDSVSGESSTSNNCSTGVAITIGVQTITIAEAIDNNTLLFSTSGSNDWYGQSSIYYHDNDATQSGNISDNESSSMQTTVTGPGIMSFFWKVSSEANYDKLNFSLDGNQQAEISGNIDWIEKSVTIPSGEHTLTWEYEKDSSVSSGTDAGWVDNLVFKPEVQQAINPAIINYLLSSEIFKTSSSLKKTGQTIIYYQGDDGYYEKGVTSHYARDDAKEVVTDHLTNLEWADDASVASVRKQWVTQANYDAGNYFDTSGDTATTYCATLALDGGGWRLPTIEELVGLSDYGRHTPAIDPVFVNVDGSLSTYWSSTSNASYSSTAWLVSFYSGTQSYGSKDYNGYVRCVRAGQ